MQVFYNDLSAFGYIHPKSMFVSSDQRISFLMLSVLCKCHLANSKQAVVSILPPYHKGQIDESPLEMVVLTVSSSIFAEDFWSSFFDQSPSCPVIQFDRMANSNRSPCCKFWLSIIEATVLLGPLIPLEIVLFPCPDLCLTTNFKPEVFETSETYELVSLHPLVTWPTSWLL